VYLVVQATFTDLSFGVEKKLKNTGYTKIQDV
jgi:hypothetical protein